MQLFKLVSEKPEFLEGLNADFDALQKRKEDADLVNSALSGNESDDGHGDGKTDDADNIDMDTTDRRGLIPLEKRIVLAACETIEGRKRGNCTRRRALLYSRPVETDIITPPEPCRVWAWQEPTDAILRFTQKWELPDQIHEALLNDACGGQYHARGLVCTRIEAMIMTRAVEVNVSVNVSLVWRSWNSPGDRAAWDVIVSARKELLRRVKAREKEVAYVRDDYDDCNKDGECKGLWYMLKKFLGLNRPWRPAWKAGGPGRGIWYNTSAVLNAAAGAAHASTLNSSTATAEDLARAAANAKVVAAFSGFFIAYDDTEDLRADPHLYSAFSISPVSFHRWRHAVPESTMNPNINLITMNANEYGRLFVDGERMPEYIPLHGKYTDSNGKYWGEVKDKDVEKFLKQQETRSKSRAKLRKTKCYRDCDRENDKNAKEISKLDATEKELRKAKGWIPLE